MGRRIRWLGVIMVACLGLVTAQLVNIQLVKAKALQTSPFNPRVAVLATHNPRGTIYAADGTVLAKSIPTPAGTNRKDYPYDYVRQYPQGALFAGITGYDSVLSGAVTDIENEYNAYLGPHTESAQSLSQLLFREKLPTTTDDVTLTVEPKLQQAALADLLATPGHNDGAVVVLNPKTGAVLAMVSNPSYDPNALVSTSLAANNLAYVAYTRPDGHENFLPLRPIANSESSSPGSTMKVVTSTTAYNLKPSLIGFDYPQAPCQSFPDDGGHPLCNDGSSPANAVPCGGTMANDMLAASCDPGYGDLGVQEGVATLRQQAELFGINSVPPIDLPAVGQQPTAGVDCVNAADTAGERAEAPGGLRDRAGDGEGHGAAERNDRGGDRQWRGDHDAAPDVVDHQFERSALVKTYTPTPMPRSASPAAAQAVTSLMESVITNPQGTAAGVGFPPYLCAAVKTGTAQFGADRR